METSIFAFFPVLVAWAFLIKVRSSFGIFQCSINSLWTIYLLLRVDLKKNRIFISVGFSGVIIFVDTSTLNPEHVLGGGHREQISTFRRTKGIVLL